MNVSLFVTCLTDTFYPRVGQAVVAVLEKLGCDVDFPAGQTCCGQPMFNTGFADDARDLARRMIDVFEGSEHVVTPSGSCCAMIHEYYPILLGDDPAWAGRMRSFVARTHEFVDFLLNVLRVDLRALGCTWPGKLTYHYSCHLRGLGQTTETTRLLDQIAGIERVELAKRDQCCGFGGTFAVKYPEISGAMVSDKVECIKRADVPTVVCNDGGCAMNIAGALHRDGANVQLKHIAEIIAEGLGLLEDAPRSTSGIRSSK
jgi:L-lactate dehydrogenase complex protein LldE